MRSPFQAGQKPFYLVVIYDDRFLIRPGTFLSHAPATRTGIFQERLGKSCFPNLIRVIPAGVYSKMSHLLWPDQGEAMLSSRLITALPDIDIVPGYPLYGPSRATSWMQFMQNIHFFQSSTGVSKWGIPPGNTLPGGGHPGQT